MRHIALKGASPSLSLSLSLSTRARFSALTLGIIMLMLTACSTRGSGIISGEGSGLPKPSPAGNPDATHHQSASGQGFSNGGAGGGLGAGGDSLLGGESLPSMFDYNETAIPARADVLQQHQVVVGGVTHLVNELDEGNPFEHSYQLENGDIVMTNRPLTDVVSGAGMGVYPGTELWTGPWGAQTVYSGQMLVSFHTYVSDAMIQQFIAGNSLTVTFADFDYPDPDETGQLNGLAVFNFSYGSQQFQDIDAAYAFFSAHPLIEEAMPDIAGLQEPDYAQNEISIDPLVANDECLQIDFFDVDAGTSPVDIGPPDGQSLSRVAVGVMDMGVDRYQEDFAIPNSSRKKVAWFGINADIAYGDTWISYWGGAPVVRYPAGDEEENPLQGEWVEHGTCVAGTIAATTRSEGLAIGVGGLSPRTGVFPIRLKYSLEKGGFDISSEVQAIAGLRYYLGQGTMYEDVRVINISSSFGLGSGSIYGFLERLINRDIKDWNRVYVGSAGNTHSAAKRVPGSYANVLGVSGLVSNEAGTQVYGNFYPMNISEPKLLGSTYWNDSGGNPRARLYPVSGVFAFKRVVQGEDWFSFRSKTPVSYGQVNNTPKYLDFSGTSFAAPQVSALAAELIMRQPWRSYTDIANRIVDTRNTQQELTSPPLAGPADFDAALAGW